MNDTLSEPSGTPQGPRHLSLDYRIRLPLPHAPDKCLVLLHGVGGNETNLLDLAHGVDASTLVVFARGPLQLAQQQYAWFRVRFTATGPQIEPDEAERSRLALIEFVGELQVSYGIKPTATVIAGFSQGGILSASVALSAPESVAGFAILSGRILPEIAPELAQKEQLARLKAFVGHGEHDSKLPVPWAHRSHQWLADLGIEHQFQLYPIDHSISADMRDDFLSWFSALTA